MEIVLSYKRVEKVSSNFLYKGNNVRDCLVELTGVSLPSIIQQQANEFIDWLFFVLERFNKNVKK